MSANRSNLLSAMTASHGSPPQINPHNEDRWPWSAAGHAGSRAKPADGAVGDPRPHTPPGAVVQGVTGMETCLLSLHLLHRPREHCPYWISLVSLMSRLSQACTLGQSHRQAPWTAGRAFIWLTPH